MSKVRSITPQKAGNRVKSASKNNSTQKSNKRHSFYDKENLINNTIAPQFTAKRSTLRNRVWSNLEPVDLNIQPFNPGAAFVKKKPAKTKARSKSVTRASKSTQDYFSADTSQKRHHLMAEYRTLPQGYQTNPPESQIYSKIGNLQKSIDSQEKALRSLQQQIELEKTELSHITDKFGRKANQNHDPRSQSHPDEFEYNSRHHDSFVVRKNSNTLPITSESNTSIQLLPHEDEEDLLGDYPLSKKNSFVIDGNRVSSLQAVKQIIDKGAEKHRKYSSTTQAFQRPSAAALNTSHELEEGRNLKSKIHNYKRYIKMTQEKHELELKELKEQISSLTQENYKLRGKQPPSKEDVYRKMEQMYKAKIAALEAQVQQREIEKTGQSAYKDQLDEITSKMMKFESEIQKNALLEEQVKILMQQLKEKESELLLAKKNHLEKIQGKIDDQSKQKKEWSRVYGELLGEIRALKGEIDLLSENKRLSSHGNWNPTNPTTQYSTRPTYY